MQKSILAAIGVAATGLAAPLAAQQDNTPAAQFVFEEIVTLGPAVAPGETPKGRRNMIPIISKVRGSTAKGSRARSCPAGGTGS